MIAEDNTNRINLFDYIGNIGVTQGSYSEQDKSTRLLNLFCFCGFIITIAFYFVATLLKREDLKMLNYIAPLLYIVTLILNSQKRYNQARWFFVSTFFLMMFIFAVGGGKEGFGQVGFLVTAIFPVLLLKEKFGHIIFLLLSIAGYFIVGSGILADFQFIHLDELSRKTAFYLSFVSTLGLIYFLTKFFKEINYAQQQEIIIQKQIIEEKNKETQQSIEYAKNIQQSILTSDNYLKDLFPEHFIFFRPKDIVGGDFYWAHKTEDNKRIISLADCTGHGIPGALMSMIGNASMNEIIIEQRISEPSEILNKMRAKIIKTLSQSGGRRMRDGMDISLCLISSDNKVLKVSGAHHPIYIFRGKKLIEIKTDKQPVGYFTEMELNNFTQQEIHLENGDMLYLFSDGYPDQFGGADGKKLKSKGFKNLLETIHELPVKDQREKLSSYLNHWIGKGHQIDDVTVIGIRILQH